MIQERYPLYLANRPRQPNAELAVVDKFTDEVVSHVALADKSMLDDAIAAAAAATVPMRRLAAWQRKAVLRHLLARCEDRRMWQRVPVGPCGFITPWNFPLNLVAHKIAPAIACGCPFVLKPASYTPISALILGEVLAETDLPEGAFSILPMRSADAAALAEDERLKKLSFTG